MCMLATIRKAKDWMLACPEYEEEKASSGDRRHLYSRCCARLLAHSCIALSMEAEKTKIMIEVS
jgi:hypothetical protein